jgi:branched-chain amino acid transport system permease protein
LQKRSDTEAPAAGAIVRPSAALYGVWLSTRLLIVAMSIAGLVALSKVMSANVDPYYFQLIILSGIYITLAVSLNLINGITGQFSIGHAGFYAVGAYVGAAWTMLLQPHVVKAAPMLALGAPLGDSLNLVIALALGAGAAAVAGLLVGLPSLRLRGDYLAIVTLGFGEVIRGVLLNLDVVGGPRGLSGIPGLVRSNDLAIFWVFGVVALVVVVSRNLLQSVRGLTWLAVREDEIAADSMGVDTTRVKVTAFVISSAFAGAAGVLFAHYYAGISPDYFDMNNSIIITTMVILGGTGSITGAILAAALLTVLPEVLRFLKDYRMVIFSTTLIVMMLTRPQGIFGTRELGFGSIARLFRRPKRSAVGGTPE